MLLQKISKLKNSAVALLVSPGVPECLISPPLSVLSVLSLLSVSFSCFGVWCHCLVLVYECDISLSPLCAERFK